MEESSRPPPWVPPPPPRTPPPTHRRLRAVSRRAHPPDRRRRQPRPRPHIEHLCRWDDAPAHLPPRHDHVAVGHGGNGGPPAAVPEPPRERAPPARRKVEHRHRRGRRPPKVRHAPVAPARHNQLPPHDGCVDVVPRDGRVGQHPPHPRRRVVRVKPGEGHRVRAVAAAVAIDKVVDATVDDGAAAATRTRGGDARPRRPPVGGGGVGPEGGEVGLPREAPRPPHADGDGAPVGRGDRLEVVHLHGGRAAPRPGPRRGVVRVDRPPAAAAEEVEAPAGGCKPIFMALALRRRRRRGAPPRPHAGGRRLGGGRRLRRRRRPPPVRVNVTPERNGEPVRGSNTTVMEAAATTPARDRRTAARGR
ncbi:hypothetical protein BU14_0964s0004 [Porphyra umbilicalis]|uniref:Uncharacterized protein n=1 Tax=Porphyra umbilicalis TaxID=2786 RepID=A0A1X6NN34_PORUM|nr:hypothetical protein BU14_0964s0004 [Porphyra umbilicalis]|eukprot:OSX69995.1 hypothetical protein BU14_0964s0004 [Porphyra umbilicalis]